MRLSPSAAPAVLPELPSGADRAAAPPRRDWSLVVQRLVDLGVFSLILWAGVLNFRNFSTDDAYITFEYAKNLLLGHGLVFHPGEPVLGTTAPAWAIVIAGFGLFLPSLQVAAMVAGWVALGLLGLALYLVAEQARRGCGFLGFIPFALVALSEQFKVSLGMEMPLMLAVGLLIIWLHVHSRWPLVLGVLCGLILLIRPDTFMLLAVVGLSALLQRRVPWLAVLGFGIVAGAWAGFAWPVYGNPIPNSMLVKWAIGSQFSDRSVFSDGLFGIQYQAYLSRGHLLWVGAAGLIAGLLLPLRSTALLCGWIGLYFLSFAVTSVSPHPWYFLPVHLLILLGVSLVPLAVLMTVNRWWLDRLAGLAILAVGLHAVSLSQRWNPPSPDGRRWAMPDNQALESKMEMAAFLNAEATPEDRVVTSEVGVLGFETDLRIVDTVGLVTAEAFPHVAARDFGWWMDLDPLPEYLALHRGFTLEGTDYSFVQQHYDLVLRTGRGEVFRRRDLVRADPRLPPEGTPGVLIVQAASGDPVTQDLGPIMDQPSGIHFVNGRTVLRGVGVLGAFDLGNTDGWRLVGEAFAAQPAAGSRARQAPVVGVSGGGLLNSFHESMGDAAEGYALSPEIPPDERATHLIFAVGGGQQPGTQVRLISNDRVLLAETGRNDETLRWVIWDLRHHAGQALWVQVQDESRSGWGHILADTFLLATELP